ncbi:hypothetical protein Q0812_04110 [Brevundimonas sp. 2R-24]|uniref:Uncharacterized protein n=1 Tax=Peiella sedimenti TaxID=3061083 RepID=A0ABT8SJ56_9CAUL|nr:hypothetical protein [Caulobacteraceae bacterium XZ-24]
MKGLFLAASAALIISGAAAPAEAKGLGIDPNGAPAWCDRGTMIDPNGCPVALDQGSAIDPNGARDKARSHMDPNGQPLFAVLGDWFAGLFWFW